MATSVGNILSKKIGSVSIAIALSKSSVTSIQWCW